MICYLYKNLLKKNSAATVITCIKSTHLRFLNSTHRYFSENVRSEISVTRNDESSIKGLFKNYGFTETQISKLLKRYPSMLTLNIDITKPKLDFLHSYGFSSTDLCQILAVDPHVLRHSLENRIIPSCEFAKSLLKDNESVVAAVKRSSHVIRHDISKSVSPNIKMLLNYGVPEYRILVMLRVQPRNLIQRTDKLKMIVEEVMKMGFDPEKNHFVDAIHLFTALSKSTREGKWDLYRKWGWSDDEILSAFRKQPFIMSTSEEKIDRVMDFLVNKMGWDVSQVSSCPHVVMHSLDNWTKPRCLVVQFLLSKDVLKENLTLNSFIILKKDRFRIRFVHKFCVEFPEVIKLYGKTEDNVQKFSRKVTK